MDDLQLASAGAADRGVYVRVTDCNVHQQRASAILCHTTVAGDRIMEIVVVTIWFYALVLAGAALAAVLVVRALRADERYLATFESAGDVVSMSDQTAPVQAQRTAA
jgi:hypothetical protein